MYSRAERIGAAAGVLIALLLLAVCLDVASGGRLAGQRGYDGPDESETAGD